MALPRPGAVRLRRTAPAPPGVQGTEFEAAPSAPRAGGAETAGPGIARGSVRVALVLAFVAPAMWGSLHPLSKLALSQVGPAQLTFLRVALGTLVLFAFCLATGQLRSLARAPRRDWGGLLLLGAFGGCASPVLATYALGVLPASVGGLFSNVSPLLVAIIGPLFFRERFGRLAIVGLLLGFVGVLVLIQPGAGPSGLDIPLAGVVVALGAAVAWALFTLAGRPVMARHRPLAVTAVACGAGTLMLAPVAQADGGLGSGFAALPAIWPLVLWIGVVANGFGYGAWMVAINVLGAARVAPCQYLVPVTGATLSMLILGEQPTPMFLIGAAMILGGVALSQIRRR